MLYAFISFEKAHVCLLAPRIEPSVKGGNNLQMRRLFIHACSGSSRCLYVLIFIYMRENSSFMLAPNGTNVYMYLSLYAYNEEALHSCLLRMEPMFICVNLY